ncbi:MAG: TetR/AcrR family transcriptional regulator [Clostridia bacterium]|nr:TetR/AcrR family transcriptional regulator [Clostridia bacterium]
MAHINKRRSNTRLQIIKLAAHLFIEEGYSVTTIHKIAKTLDLSPGNITFYFPTKEHLLAVLTGEMFDFQNWLMEKEAEEGASSLLSYCLELTSIAAACEQDEVTKDFFASSYSSPMILQLIRENDTEKTKRIFADFRPEWKDEDWRATENIVSGIEYATIMTCEADTPLDMQIERALDSILMLYGVPLELRRQKIEKVLKLDYRGIGARILRGFKEYIDRVNEENLERSVKCNNG